MSNAYNDAPEPSVTHRLPFATPLMLADGQYSLVRGEIEFDAQGNAFVASLTVGEPTYRAGVTNQWRAAGAEILKWLVREKAGV